MLNKKLLMAISNIKELYQELKFTSMSIVNNENIFKDIPTITLKTQLNNKLNLQENNIKSDQNIFSINITNNSSYTISGNLEKFPSVNFYNCQWLETVNLPEVMWNYRRNNYETNMSKCFYLCTNLTTAPNIPDSVVDMSDCFSKCSRLTTISNIPNSVINMSSCFFGCYNLTTAPEYIGNSVINMSSCFYRCGKLATAPNIPDSVTDMKMCFSSCGKLTTAPEYIGNSVINMSSCFFGCYNLTTAPNIPDSVTRIAGCFYDCTNLTTAPNIPDSVTSIADCFHDCTNLTTAPEYIGNSVTDMSYCFYDCSNLSGNITINSTEVTIIRNSFYNHSFNYPLNVYIYTHYSNGEQTTTYNTFLNDTSHGTNWVLNTPQLGITLKSLNKEILMIPSITSGSTLFISGVEKSIDTNFSYYDKILEYYCYHPNYPVKHETIDLSDAGDSYTLTIDMTNYTVSTNTITITTPEGFTSTKEISYGYYTYTTNENSVTLTVENNTEINYKVKDIKNNSEPDKNYKTYSESLVINENKEINIVPEEVNSTEIIYSYPFTDDYGYLNNLVDDNNFIINDSLSAITSGSSSYNVNSGTSYGYVEFTTPDIETTLSITGYVSSELNWDYGAIYLGSIQYKPTRTQIKNKTTNSSDSGSKYLYSNSGNQSSTTITETLQPNTKYVVSFAYCKDSSGNAYQDRLIITNIKFTVPI